MHASIDGEEIMEIERICLEDEGVKAEIAKLQLPEGTVVISDPWIYGMLSISLIFSNQPLTLLGSDGVNDDDRLFQCFLYLRDPHNSSEADSNHYALPIPISPVIDGESMKVIRIDILPTGVDNTLKPTEPYKIQPPNEYIPEAQKMRTDLKPLNVVQPEGASFQVTQEGTSNVIEWQKWSFRVSLKQHRELRKPSNPCCRSVSTIEKAWFCTMSAMMAAVCSTV